MSSDTLPPPSPPTIETPGPAEGPSRSMWWLHHRRRLLQVAGAVGVTVAAILALDLALDYTHHATVSVPETIGRLEIDVHGGNVEIVGTDDDATSVEVTTHSGLTSPHRSETVSDETLVIKTSCRMIFTVTCESDYVIHVPRSVDVVARGGGTDYTMTGLDGNVDVALSGGDADLSFSRTPQLVRARLSGGDLTVTVPSGDTPRVSADSSGGSVRVEIATDPSTEHSIDANTSGGDVVVRYPSASAP